ncbi:MAG TPA: cyclic nucleotide-binding domain-containing protein [Candidatus Latescibacteria bacterium]|jgi:CRP-like cAMP-binding protein|nr:cyclic nucleotide-binding protein [Gemmatimonadaceae bacterium]MDP6017552.1 cyclic nucleotide-binding domain-containing protein [Candidatus Latescibacterota bacterium]HJP29430.1 cyclic nucleotide-binding domain-containing protein [Candidatus Latescibacterota bacterium]
MTENSTLSLSPLLVGLADEELQALLALGERREHAGGEVIVREGTASDCLFVLEQGSVQVEREAGGRRIPLATLDEPGDFFGEMSLIDILPRSADIRALTDTRIFAFPKKQLSGFFTQSPRVQMTMILNISRNLSLRLREADAKIVALSSGA